MKPIELAAWSLMLMILLLAPAFAVQVNLTSIDPDTGPYNGGTEIFTVVNGTYGPGAGLDRNMTYIFNVSAYVGNTLSSVRMWKFSAATWSASGGTAGDEPLCIYVRSYDGAFSQASPGVNATNSSAGVPCPHDGDFLTNGTWVHWAPPGGVVLTGESLSVSFFFSPNGVYGWVSGAPQRQWGKLVFDTDDLTPTGFSTTSETFGYYPIDSALNGTFVPANALAFLAASRDGSILGGETNYALVQGADGSPRYAKGYRANDTFVAFSFNSSEVTSPSRIRAFLQVQNDYAVSSVLEDWEENFVVFGKYDKFYAPLESALIQNLFVAPMYAMEVYTKSDGTQPVACWASTTKSDVSAQEVVRAACSAAAGVDDPADKVILTWENGTDIVTITNSSRSDWSGAIEYVSPTDEAYGWKVVSASRGNVTKRMASLTGRSTAGSFFAWSQKGANGLWYSSISGATLTPFTGLPGTQAVFSSAVDLFDYGLDESAKMNVSVSKRFESLAVSPADPARVRATGFHYAYLSSSWFGLISNVFDFQQGVVSYYIPQSSAGSADVTCGTANVVTVLANIPQSVPCIVDIDSIARSFANPFALTPLPTGTSSFEYSDFASARFRGVLTDDAYPVSASVTNFVTNAVVSSEFSTPTLTLLSQSYPANISRTFLASVAGSDGRSYSTVFSVFFAVGGTLPNATANFRAVFISENSTDPLAFLPLPNVTVSVGASSSICSTSAENISLNGVYGMWAYCDLVVPEQLVPISTTYSYWNGTDLFTRSLNQTYFGTFPSDVYASFGLSAGQKGGVYYVFFDGLGVNVQGAKEGTCNSSSTWLQTIDGQDVCTTRSCPISTSITDVEGREVTPLSFVCVTPGHSECRTDSVFGVYYVASCGNVCQAVTRLCPSGCNTDNSGCSGEQTVDELALGGSIIGPLFAGFGFWGTWALAHIAFVIALTLGLLIFIISAMSGNQLIFTVGTVLSLFVLLGGAILSMPAGLAVFLGVVLLAGVGGLFLLFGAKPGG